MYISGNSSGIMDGVGYNLLESSNHINISARLTLLQGRIAELTDYRVYGAKRGNDLIHLYSTSYEESHLEIMRCAPFDHTMFESIDSYCHQKFPVDSIKQGIINNWKFEVHGIFPSHFENVADYLDTK